MSYITITKNSRVLKSNKIKNNIFKTVLFTIAFSVIILILVAFIAVIYSGISLIIDDPNLNFTEILFGGSFILGTAGMGIIVFNTIWMAFLVLLVAVPVSVATALLITKIFPKFMSSFLIGVVIVLAAIPSVIYGAFGYYLLDPMLVSSGIVREGGSLLSVILIVSLMVIPTITMMTTTSILMVDKKMEDSSDALGATKTQTSIYVTLRSARPGIIIGSLFALGRAMGEATAISMLSGAVMHADGVTINIFTTSLFMSPAIMSALGGSGQMYEVTYYILSSLLIITIIIIFSLAKWLEHTTSDVVKSKKQSSIVQTTNNAMKKYKSQGISSLSSKEQSIIVSRNKEEDYNKHILIKNTTGIQSFRTILYNTSLEETKKFEKYKRRKSAQHKTFLSLFAFFGFVSLLMIFYFLFSDGISLLNWNHLTNSGFYSIEGKSEIYYGLSIPLFGTFVTTISSLFIALPIGILIGMYLHIYLKKGTKLNNFASFMFQVMTSIPAVIYGTIAIFIFAGTHIDSEMKSFEPILMLSLVILPTIIKQTEEGMRNVEITQEEASYSLGATKSYTSRRIFLLQAMPAILSAAVLASAIVIADSAIMITIIGQVGLSTDHQSWLSEGGYTLSTRIYYLYMNADNTSQIIAAQEQIKTIGIILIVIILWMSAIGQMLKSKNNYQASCMAIGIILSVTSIFIVDGGLIIMFFIGILFALIALIFIPIYKVFRRK